MALAGPPQKMWAIRISVVVFGLLAMAQQSTPLSLRNPVKIIYIGNVNGTDVVHARAGELMVNVGSTVQVMVDISNVRGIVNYGDAASIDGSVFIRDVSVPNQNSSTDQVEEFLRDMFAGNMTVEDFNVPKEGKNSLGCIFYWKSTWFTGRQQKNTGFWLPADEEWLTIASQIEGLELEQWVIGPNQPKVKFGLKAGSGGLSIVNKAYGDFLYDTFNISAFDTSDSAIAMTCFSNEIPFIVFRGASYIVENNPRPPCFLLGNSNAVEATAAFLGLLSAKEDSVAKV
ncbi:hypothetical protein JCGZ_08891 [Jatropha curcas]|uniref:Nucleoside phosphorylase domain-containing protein n=1 Tax=Jatropha curcas TaxID=180498 RepID=A0A067KNR1_JATCU|nr:hypothetical protein JCGZ_08891 [Jatropha curcas]